VNGYERVILGLCSWSIICLGETNDVRPGAAAYQLRVGRTPALEATGPTALTAMGSPRR
jgi:hypothetical protein